MDIVDIRQIVVSKVKRRLEGAKLSYTTTEMIDFLSDYSTQELERKRVGRVLLDAAKRELCEYATQGEPVSGRGYNTGRLVRPWVWHAPVAGREPVKQSPPITLADLMSKLAAIEELLRTIADRQAS